MPENTIWTGSINTEALNRMRKLCRDARVPEAKVISYLVEQIAESYCLPFDVTFFYCDSNIHHLEEKLEACCAEKLQFAEHELIEVEDELTRKRTIYWDTDAWEEYLYWQEHDKDIAKRINTLIKDMESGPFPPGNPDSYGGAVKLDPSLSGLMYKKIDERHNLVYRLYNGLSDVIIISCKVHDDAQN